MNISMSRSSRAARLSRPMRLSRAGRHGRSEAAQELVYRKLRPTIPPVQPPIQRIIHNTVHQTVVHLHQTTHRHVVNHTAAGSGTAELIVRQTLAPPATEDRIDPSRPTLMASRLLRVLSTDSAQKIVQPYFYRIIQSFLEQEREIRHSSSFQNPSVVRSGLSSAEFQALVQSTAEALDRRNRRNTLRLGGNI